MIESVTAAQANYMIEAAELIKQYQTKARSILAFAGLEAC